MTLTLYKCKCDVLYLDVLISLIENKKQFVLDVNWSLRIYIMTECYMFDFQLLLC